MTLRPHPQRTRFVAHEEPKEPLGVCQAPRCTRMATERHHIFSRAELGKPTDWVRDVETDERIFNICELCSDHHRDLHGRTFTGHRARISYDNGAFWWETQDTARLLDPQPHVATEEAA